jgi:hypothetical protein
VKTTERKKLKPFTKPEGRQSPRPAQARVLQKLPALLQPQNLIPHTSPVEMKEKIVKALTVTSEVENIVFRINDSLTFKLSIDVSRLGLSVSFTLELCKISLAEDLVYLCVQAQRETSNA